MVFSLPPLPYSPSALEPYMSVKTFSFHYDKHHKTYVDNLNNIIKDTDLINFSLEDIIKQTHNKSDKIGIFNNAAQVWDHTFFWNCMQPNGGGKPVGKIAALIDNYFGSYEKFASDFKQAAISQFGSGWAWLVQNEKGLGISKTSNADLPIVYGDKALLTCDVWEHAYYLDYQNRRADFVQVFLDHLINWDFVNQQLG